MNRVTRVAVAALLLFSAACGDEPVTPSTASVRPQLATAQGGDLTKLARWSDGGPNILFGFAMKSIGSAGGTIKLAGFEVIVPAGAVLKPTNFTIKLPADPSGSRYVWAEFGPHNQTFAVPVTLVLPYRGTTSEGSDTAVHVMWNDGGTWVKFETSVTADGRIQTNTNHFSEYGTEETEPARGITLAGKPVVR
jgi:hypothetical protein